MSNPKEIFVTRPTFVSRTFSFRNLLIITIVGFSILTFFAKQYAYFNFDLSITLFIQNYNIVWFDTLMKFVTYMGNFNTVVVLVVLLAIYGYTIGKRHAPIVVILSTFGGLILSILLKMIVGRPRPDPNMINQIGSFFWLDSFPSGHVLGAVSLYGFLLYIAYTQLQKSTIRNLILMVCSLFIVLMGLSRIYLGAHWFSDVLGAYLIGFVWLSLIIFIYQNLKPKVRPLS